MPSKTEIVNLGISHIGVGNLISNIDTEKSEEAAAAKLAFNYALGELLRSHRFPYFTKYPYLALVEESPNLEWAYSYRIPNESAQVIRLVSGMKVDTPDTRVKYTQAIDDEGLLILTDQRDAQAEIIINNPDPRFYPYDFSMCLSYRIGQLLCPRLAGADVFKITERLGMSFDKYLSRAIATGQNEEERATNDISGFQAARG